MYLSAMGPKEKKVDEIYTAEERIIRPCFLWFTSC